jgi:hypothetical protein
MVVLLPHIVIFIKMTNFSRHYFLNKCFLTWWCQIRYIFKHFLYIYDTVPKTTIDTHILISKKRSIFLGSLDTPSKSCNFLFQENCSYISWYMELLKNVTHHENSESPIFQEKIILRYSCKHFQHKIFSKSVPCVRLCS